jgi:hypothetical protein
MCLKLVDQAGHRRLAAIGFSRHCREGAGLHDPVERAEGSKQIHYLTVSAPNRWGDSAARRLI